MNKHDFINACFEYYHNFKNENVLAHSYVIEVNDDNGLVGMLCFYLEGLEGTNRYVIQRAYTTSLQDTVFVEWFEEFIALIRSEAYRYFWVWSAKNLERDILIKDMFTDRVNTDTSIYYNIAC